MPSRKIRRGYVPYRPGKRIILKRKYPFAAMKEGDHLEPPYPLEDRDRVRAAVRYWNKAYDTALEINATPEGLIVWWPKKPLPESGATQSPGSA